MTDTIRIQKKALRSAFLEGMSRIASTVSIVATDGLGGRAGATISSQVSVSADTDRPTLLICLQRESETARAVRVNGVFSVNALSQDQEKLAEIFAGRLLHKRKKKFEFGDWVSGSSGSPRLCSALTTFDCEVVDIMSIGRHGVVFGEVTDIVVERHNAPLVYADRRFNSVRRIGIPEAQSAA